MSEKTEPKGIEVDLSEWPIVLVRWGRTVSDEDLSAYLAEVSRVRRQRAAYVAVHDGSMITSLTAKQRHMYIESLKKDKEEVGEYCRAAAFVLQSAPARGLLTAALWIYTPGFPVKVFREMDAAKEWARQWPC